MLSNTSSFNSVDNVNRGIIPTCCTPTTQPIPFAGYGQMQYASGNGNGSTAGPWKPGMVMLPSVDFSGPNAMLPGIVGSYGSQDTGVGPEDLAEPDENAQKYPQYSQGYLEEGPHGTVDKYMIGKDGYPKDTIRYGNGKTDTIPRR